MPTEKIKEYEAVEKTHTVIQCDNCSTEWSDRSEPNLIVLNLHLKEMSMSPHRGKYRRKFKSHLLSQEEYLMDGDAFLDLCDSCWSEKSPDYSMVEIEKTDYELSENTRTEHYCYFCDHSMGSASDNSVYVNPVVKSHSRSGSRHSNTRVEAQNIGDRFHIGQRRDDREYDSKRRCCDSCAEEMFGIGCDDDSDDSLMGRIRQFLLL